MLEHGRGIGRPQRSDLVFEMTLATLECSLPLVSRLHPDLVVGITKIYFGEDAGPMKPVQHFRYEREGVAVFNGDFVSPGNPQLTAAYHPGA